MKTYWLWIWLTVGVLMTAAGVALKISGLDMDSIVIEYDVFSGNSYVLAVSGIFLIVVSLGYDLLFGPDESEEDQARNE